MKIGELARTTGIKAETIRYYESVGLLGSPTRTSNNYRTYGDEDLCRLSLIRELRGLGFEMDEVRTLIDLSEAARDRDLILADAKRNLRVVDEKSKSLRRLRRVLSEFVSAVENGSPLETRTIDKLMSEGVGRLGTKSETQK